MGNVKHAYFRWEKNENQRYYEARVDRDLFGWELMRLWGRKGTSLGRIVRLPLESFESGINHIKRIDIQRKRRGYVQVLSKGTFHD